MRKKFKIWKKIGKSSLVQTVIGRLMYLYVLAAYKTSRWTIEGTRDEYVSGDFSYLIAFWHGRAFSDMFLVWGKKLKKDVAVLLSLHRDGRIMASAMDGLGIGTIGGSSKRGGAAAALDIMRRLRKPANVVAIAPDGRKPGYKMTDGLVQLAQKSRRPVVLSAYSVRRGRLLKTWDRFLIPGWFTKGVLLLDEPVYIPADLDAAGIEKWRQILEDRLIGLTEEADRRAGLKCRVSLRDKGENK